MTTGQLEKAVLEYTKGLPKEALKEILDFIQFIRQKKSSDNLTSELTRLNSLQIQHLEEEFQDYRQLYPSE